MLLLIKISPTVSIHWQFFPDPLYREDYKRADSLAPTLPAQPPAGLWHSSRDFLSPPLYIYLFNPFLIQAERLSFFTWFITHYCTSVFWRSACPRWGQCEPLQLAHGSLCVPQSSSGAVLLVGITNWSRLVSRPP